MSSKDTGIDRRKFLQYSTVAGLSTLVSASWPGLALAATQERLTILSSIGLDSLHPYAHSSGPQYGIWQHMIEPLIDVNYSRKEYYGVLAESWEFQGKRWVFRLKKGIRFHNGSPFNAHDVVHSINRMRNDKKSLQKSNFRDLTEIQAQDDYTVIFTTAVPNAVFLDRLHNRFMISKSAAEKYGDEVDQYAIGTGPYKFVSWARDGNLVMTRNDDYWGPRVGDQRNRIEKSRRGCGTASWPVSRARRRHQQFPVRRSARLDKHPRVRVGEGGRA